MKKILMYGFSGLTIGTLAIVSLFGVGKIANIYDRTINKESVSIQREKFKESKSYVEGMINTLAEYQREYERAETKEEKEQIRNLIDSKFSNFNIDYIENKALYNFLQKVRGGKLDE
ncbi:MAG: hypothetical protein E6936_15520 [Clostridium perfringens]|nr:hypothetical protein [Clostridium perfringens]